VRFEISGGREESELCARFKQTRFVRFPISGGNERSELSGRSRTARLVSVPISGGNETMRFPFKTSFRTEVSVERTSPLI